PVQSVLQMAAEDAQRVEDRRLLPQRAPGIGVPEIAHLEMEVRAGGVAALSDGGERLARGGAVAGLYLRASGLEVREQRKHAVAGCQTMRDDDELTPASVTARLDHHAIGRRTHFAALFTIGEIEAEMAVMLALHAAGQQVAVLFSGSRKRVIG